MAKQTQNATLPDNKHKAPSSRTFLCCFGSSEDGEVPDIMSPPSKVPAAAGNAGVRKRSRWFCWSLKVNSAARTAPVVDLTNLSENPCSKDKIDALPSKSKSSVKLRSSKPAAEKVTGKRRVTFSSRKPPSLAPAAPDQQTSKQKTKEGLAQNTVLEKRRDSDTGNDATGQKRRSFCRKIDAMRTRSSSQPGSPVEDKKQQSKSSSTRRTGRAMPHSAATNSRKPASPPAKKQTDTEEKIDPVVGMSIILVTLIIMLLWGRVCAILSTSAWFYIVPRLSKSTKTSDRDLVRDNNDQNDSFWDEQGLSYEYKKRVVLEGFLERSHRTTSQIMF